MYPINDRQYIKICAEIAKIMSISLSSAKKKVEIKIAKEGSKTIQEKIQVAKNLLEICENNEGDKLSSSRILDKLMETINDEDNFLTED
jgi:transposase|tara:strand:+ start:302 stop:568 length:267 start_codon:yes stop_codon:yes gene_type:complete